MHEYFVRHEWVSFVTEQTYLYLIRFGRFRFVLLFKPSQHLKQNYFDSTVYLIELEVGFDLDFIIIIVIIMIYALLDLGVKKLLIISCPKLTCPETA